MQLASQSWWGSWVLSCRWCFRRRRHVQQLVQVLLKCQRAIAGRATWKKTCQQHLQDKVEQAYGESGSPYRTSNRRHSTPELLCSANRHSGTSCEAGVFPSWPRMTIYRSIYREAMGGVKSRVLEIAMMGTYCPGPIPLNIFLRLEGISIVFFEGSSTAKDLEESDTQ